MFSLKEVMTVHKPYPTVSSAVNGHSKAIPVNTPAPLIYFHGAIPTQSVDLRPADDRRPAWYALPGLVAGENPAHRRRAAARRGNSDPSAADSPPRRL